MEKSEEKELVRRAQKDPEAFGVFFDRYYNDIFAYCLKRVGNVQASQDIAAKTFFRALDRLWQFRWRNISIISWLYRIAINEINQHFRQQKRNKNYSLEVLREEQGFELPDETDMWVEILEQEKELTRAKKWRELNKEIKKLPEKYQEVLTLRYFEEKKIAEIAEILGKKEGTIKSLLSRAIIKLRKKCN